MENNKFAPLDPINRMQEIFEQEIIKDIRKELEETDRFISGAHQKPEQQYNVHVTFISGLSLDDARS